MPMKGAASDSRTAEPIFTETGRCEVRELREIGAPEEKQKLKSLLSHLGDLYNLQKLMPSASKWHNHLTQKQA